MAVRPLFRHYVRDYTSVVKVVAIGTVLRARREERAGGKKRAGGEKRAA